MLKLTQVLIFGWVLFSSSLYSQESGIVLIRTSLTISTNPYVKTSEQTRIVLDLHQSTLTFIGEDNGVETYPLDSIMMDDNGTWIMMGSAKFQLTTHPQTCRMISLDGKINVLWKNI